MKSKRDRFVKVAASRVQKTLDALDSLSKCGSKANYEYTDVDVRKMEKVIRDKVKEAMAKFGSGSSEKEDKGFRF